MLDKYGRPPWQCAHIFLKYTLTQAYLHLLRFRCISPPRAQSLSQSPYGLEWTERECGKERPWLQITMHGA